MLSSLLNKLESMRPFTENEAWGLFRIAAISEAFGWTTLITGILIRHYNWPGSNIAVPIAGQIHGTIFLAYFGILIATYSSLRWSRKKFLVAVLAGIPPYGTLLFELWASSLRRNKLSKLHFNSIAFVIMSKAAAT
jgi:integral membrane protein